MEDAVARIREAGFEPGLVDPDPRFRADGKNWWKVGNPEDYVMPDPLASAGSGCCCGKRS